MEDMQTETLKDALKYLHWRQSPCEATGLLKYCSEFSEQKRLDISKRYGCRGGYQCPKNSEFVVISHQTRLETL